MFKKNEKREKKKKKEKMKVELCSKKLKME